MQTPAIILVRPQMGENIGAAARVMMNFGLDDLRVVAPRDGWPNPKAVDMAASASGIIEQAQIYNDLGGALGDLQYACAITARERDMEKPHYDSSKFADNLPPGKLGMVFGPERSGLTNEDISLVDSIVTIPTGDVYPSLNLAQAVAILCYEWFSKEHDDLAERVGDDKASKKGILAFFEHLEGLLDEAEFFKIPEKREKMVQNIRNIFHKAELTEQEVRTLRGILTALGRKN